MVAAESVKPLLIVRRHLDDPARMVASVPSHIPSAVPRVRRLLVITELSPIFIVWPVSALTSEHIDPPSFFIWCHAVVEDVVRVPGHVCPGVCVLIVPLH